MSGGSEVCLFFLNIFSFVYLNIYYEVLSLSLNPFIPSYIIHKQKLHFNDSTQCVGNLCIINLPFVKWIHEFSVSILNLLVYECHIKLRMSSEDLINQKNVLYSCLQCSTSLQYFKQILKLVMELSNSPLKRGFLNIYCINRKLFK